LFWRIQNNEEARYIIKQCSYGFLVVAGLNIILGFFINLGIMLDGVIYLVLGLLLHNSKIGAIITLLVSGIGVVTTFLNKMGVTGGGRNIVLAIFLLYYSIAAVYATVKYPKSA